MITLMQKYRRILPVFVLFLLILAGQVQASPEPLRATLKNGLRVVIERNTLAPVAAIEVNYLAGANESPEGFPGMAHAQEHMMFRGSRDLSSDQLATIIAALGGDFNAETQQTVTQYFFTVPADLIDVALRIEATRMTSVLDSQDLWEKERGAIEQEVAQDLSNPLYLLSSRLLEVLFAGTPYARDGLGTRASFQKTTGAMLKKFHETWYAPNNAVLVIVGDIDPKKTLALVKKLFGPIPARPLPARPRFILPPLQTSTIALESDLPYGMAVVAYRLPGVDSPDFAAGTVLADVLDSKRAALYGLVPDGKAILAGFDGAALPKAAYGYAAVTYPQGADGNALIAAIKEIVAGYVRDGIPSDLVEAAKLNEISDAEFRRNSISGLAAEWSQAIAIEGRATLNDDIDMVKKVTKADVDRVAKQCLKNETAVVALLTPRPSGTPSPDTLKREKESFAPVSAKAVAVPAWAKKATILPAVPQQTGTPALSILPNGLRLIVYPSSISGTVSVYGQIRNNPMVQTPEDKEGVAELLEKLFDAGSQKKDRLTMLKALDEISASQTAGTSFSLHVLADRFDRGMELLSENILQPALPEHAFAVVRKDLADTIQGELLSPQYLSSRALRTALYPEDDESLREPTPETIAAITLDDVRTYYRAVFRPDMTTLVVIGAVTTDQARSVVEKYFGKWTSSGPKPETDLPSAPPNRAAAMTVPDTGRVQAEVTLAGTVGITRSHPDYYAIQLGRTVLSGAFYATRLERDLREEAGLVYSVDAFLDAGRTRSLFGVVYACDPANVGRARTIIERDLKQLQTTLITEDELLQAKTLLIRQIPLVRSSLDGIAGNLLHLSLDDLPLDEPFVAAGRYRDITAENVRDAFAKWIRIDDLVQITLGPESK